MDTDGITPIGCGIWRTEFLRDNSGIPEPLPNKVFFVVTVEEPRSHSTLTPTLSAFIATPDAEMCSFVQNKFFQDRFCLESVSCTFYCRATMDYIYDIGAIRREDWRQELFTSKD